MPEGNGHSDGADVTQVWRNWLSETERQWNNFFGDVLGTESFARVAGSYTEGYALLQRSLSRSMERYLNTFNLPTHADIVELGERLHGIEERLASLETTVGNLAEAAGVTPSVPVTRLRPRRTRRPRNQNSGDN